MRKTFAVLSSLALLAAPGLALAEDPPVPAEGTPPANVAKPTPEAVKSVWEFYTKGKGAGVVLVEGKLCLEIGKAGDEKNECTKEVPAEGVKAGTSVTVWQAYFVPQGDAVEDITLQLRQGDTVRETKDIKVKGDSWRIRNWNSVRMPTKPGAYTLVLARGADVLKTFTVNVTK